MANGRSDRRPFFLLFFFYCAPSVLPTGSIMTRKIPGPITTPRKMGIERARSLKTKQKRTKPLGDNRLVASKRLHFWNCTLTPGIDGAGVAEQRSMSSWNARPAGAVARRTAIEEVVRSHCPQRLSVIPSLSLWWWWWWIVAIGGPVSASWIHRARRRDAESSSTMAVLGQSE